MSSIDDLRPLRRSTEFGVIGVCMAVAAGASWGRVLAGGSLATMTAPWLLWPCAIVGIAGAIAFRAYLRAARDPGSWSTLLCGAIAIHIIAAMALPLTSNDVWSNLAYGRLAASGQNPFLHSPSALQAGDPVRALVDPHWMNVPMVYGPLLGVVCSAVARTGTLVGDLVAFKAVMLAAALVCVFAAARLCWSQYSGREARTRFVLFACSPLFAWEVSGQAHNDGILLVALIGFTFAAIKRREGIAIVCLALGIAAKFVAAPVAAFYFVHLWRTNRWRAVVLNLVLVCVCVVAILPWWEGPKTLSALWATHAVPQLPHTSHSIADLLYWIAAPLGATWQHVACQSVVVAGFALLIAISAFGIIRIRTAAHALRYSLVFFLVSDVFALGWFQPWYILWAMPLALVDADRRWLQLTSTYAGLTLFAYVLPIDPVGNVVIDIYIATRIIALARSSSTLTDQQAERG